jgi:hypothetical protein
LDLFVGVILLFVTRFGARGHVFLID